MKRTTTVSTLSLVALLSATACSGGPGTSKPAPTAEAHAAPTVAAQAVQTAPRHGPLGWFFRQVSTLELRDSQRTAIAAIADQLKTDMLPHREALRVAIRNVADAVEVGQLDATKAAEQTAELQTALAGVKASFATAINGVHDTLDAPQRVALVEKLKAQHAGHARDAEHSHGLTKLAFEIGLTEEQQARIADAFSKGLDELFPDRKARRERWEAKMTAMGTAFVTDDFDAADFDLAEHAGEALASSVEVATRAVDVSNRVLSGGQRRLAADWLREKSRDL